MILSCNQIEKSYADKSILKDVSFHVNEKDRIAVVGANGVGKTTLLRIIVGKESADAGEMTISKDLSIGYLPQQMGYHSDKSIYDELLAVKSDTIKMDQALRDMEEKISVATGSIRDTLLEKYQNMQTEFENSDGYTYKSQVLGVINGLGFGGDAMHTCINHLSGGQKTRVALGKILLLEPELLILDEPTNHLDLDAIRWLETYLSAYKGSVLIVSHDRYFLDKVITQIVEIEAGKSISFKGNYTVYASEKEKLRKELIHRYQNEQNKIKHQEQAIEKLRSFNREKSIKRARSHEKMLAKMDRMQKPTEHTKDMSLTLTPSITSGKDVLSVKNLSKSFDDNLLFKNTDIDIYRGERIAIIGANGTGKTTLLKIISGMETFDTGSITLGTNVETGYYDQEHGILNDDKSIFDEIHDEYPYLTHTEIRNTLASFLFTGDDVYKPISMLSGGEKGRVSLAKLMLSEANLLILDEPTNHLDIASVEILEDALRNYTGTVLYVSHDRYFIERTATRILELCDKRFLNYIGNYSYYLEKKDDVHPAHSEPYTSKPGTDTVSKSKLDRQRQKEEEKNLRRIKRRYDEVEEKISSLESEIADIDKQLSDPKNGTDVKKLTTLTAKRDECDLALSKLMDEWESLAEVIV